MSNKKYNNRKRGDIVWAELGQHPGKHIQSGRRPCLIVNTDKSRADVYTVMPGTRRLEKKDFPVHVTVEPADVKGFLNPTTIFMAEQLVTIDEKQILMKAGFLERESEAMKKVGEVLIRQLELGLQEEKTWSH